MKSEHAATIQLGAGLGLAYCIGSHLMSFTRDFTLDLQSYLVLFSFHVGLSLLSLLLSSTRQVVWFRRAWLVPWGSIWGLGLLTVATGSMAVWVTTMAAAMAVTPAPLVWAGGAWWIWSRDRIRQRGW